MAQGCPSEGQPRVPESMDNDESQNTAVLFRELGLCQAPGEELGAGLLFDPHDNTM